MQEKANSIWLKLIELIILLLIGAAALVVLLPLIILSLQVVLVTSLLLAAGACGVWLSEAAAQLRAWFEKHHWIIHKPSGPPGLKAS